MVAGSRMCCSNFLEESSSDVARARGCQRSSLSTQRPLNCMPDMVGHSALRPTPCVLGNGTSNLQAPLCNCIHHTPLRNQRRRHDGGFEACPLALLLKDAEYQLAT